MKFKTIKGSTKLFEDNSFTFTPYGEGEPQSEEIKKVGDSRLSRSNGQKTQSVIAHLKVKADCPDVTAALYDELEKLTKDQQTGTKPPSPKGRVLASTDDYKLCLNQQGGRIELSMAIDLRKDVEYMKKFNDLTYKISQCLYYNETLVRQLCRALATSSRR